MEGDPLFLGPQMRQHRDMCHMFVQSPQQDYVPGTFNSHSSLLLTVSLSVPVSSVLSALYCCDQHQDPKTLWRKGLLC